MKKYSFLLCAMISFLYACGVTCCPCEFSPEDKRPFFEQYEDISSTSQEEEGEEE